MENEKKLPVEREQLDIEEMKINIAKGMQEVILLSIENLKNGRPIDIQGLQTLFDGIRVLHHIQKMCVMDAGQVSPTRKYQ